MHPGLEKAIDLLTHSQDTCVLCKDDQVIRSRQRGVAPLMALLDTDLRNYCAADKVVGKATALLYCLFQVRAVYAGVMSRPALQVLQSYGIEVVYDKLVDAIINRTGDGFCPMETATKDISDPRQAPDAIRTALKSLSS